jgi:hypothetical protein
MTMATYTPSPRSIFSGPAHIPYDAATRHRWGDQIFGVAPHYPVEQA